MPTADPAMADGFTLEALQSRPGAIRRPRPPTLDLSAPEENRIPLRNDKVNRRESRLGLRSIFGRSKAPKEPEGPISPTHSDLGSIRASVADMTSWPYAHEPVQSQTTLPEAPLRPLSIAIEPPGPGQVAHQPTANGPRRKTPAARMAPQPRDGVARWDQPPLFKAYPQAITHSTLPATTLSGDAILRLHEKIAETGNETGEGDQGKEKEKRKRKPRRNTSLSAIKLEWTTKIFILVTSGYLLQYSSEGAFDRLPEKVLHLSKTSAAFASDIIPGRHWVLQVSTAVETEELPSAESRSIFSRLTFRPPVIERRRASNFLLVFESAGDMEGWMATLRREIEKMGGKRKLSETGKPSTDDDNAGLRERPSQRTLVVRDPDRYSWNVPNDLPWRRDSDVPPESESSVTVTESDMTHDQSLDDISTTNSVISHDGHQLDALRDSANRLSFISSGQRTIVTSAGSSPACSPTAESFPSQPDETRPSLETRQRPNASSIASRRQSLQTMGPFVELTGVSSPGPRPQSTLMATSRAEAVISPMGSYAPNFSVPHSSNRRFSYMKASPPDSDSSPTSPSRDSDSMLRAAGGKSPPTSRRATRPLSMVADQPSPKEVIPERPATGHGDVPLPSSTPERPAVPPRSLSRGAVQRAPEFSSRRSSLLPRDTPVRPGHRSSPRRLASMGALRSHEEEPPRMRNLMVQGRLPESRNMQSHLATSWSAETDRSQSSLGMYGGPRSRSPVPAHMLKRSSMVAVLPERPTRSSMASIQVPYISEPPAPSAPPPSGPLPPLPGPGNRQSLRVDMRTKALYNRRSMPQLVEGPPPAPPPSCALPPIPQKLSVRT